MIIVGSAKSNKTELLIKEYVSLVNQGLKPDEILVLTLNSYKRDKISSFIQAFLPALKPNVQTFLGLCYNSVLNNWDEIEKNITIGEKKETPLLCGLEVSQSLFSDAVKKAGFKDYNSKINLIHQLLRRHSLIVCNNLSDEAVAEKSAFLGEAFAEEAKTVLDLFKLKTLELRVFDYLRQQSLFKFLYENTSALSYIKYLLIDDYDEQTPACTDFFKYIKPQLKKYVLALNPNGSTRCGYLCADLNSVEILKEDKNIISAVEEISSPQFESFASAKRLEMLKKCANEVLRLIGQGVSCDEIAVVTPVFDNQLKFTFKTIFDKYQIPVQFISGSEKLADDRIIKSILCLLKLINLKNSSIDDVSRVLSILLKFPYNQIYEILKSYERTSGFSKLVFKDDLLNEKYEKFLLFVKNIDVKEKLSVQLNKIYSNFIVGYAFSDVELSNIKFFEKQIKNLETVLSIENKEKILNQLENSIIAENDIDGFKIERNTVIIGTPQKIADIELKTKYQFWLDVTNDEWIKQDTGTLYNAWVFARSWKKETFDYQDSINCVKNKTKRLLKKLTELASNKIFLMSSMYNSLGQENTTDVSDIISVKTVKASPRQEKIVQKKFIPREDQKPVLNYKKGKMAVMAVPGAGKTTVMQELVFNLIRNGVDAEKIFVLTYMDSAAKVFKERILTAYPDLKSYPNISTIHGLALRIIKENGNYSKVNLDENFDICDEIFRQKIIREVIGELGLKYDEYEKYDKGISIIKFVDIELEPKDKDLKDFLAFYTLYKNKLGQRNLIDYDDMLIYAVDILEKNPQILAHYQNICEYIIEDEAQDSSFVQQKLISLLGAKSGNIVRCGDINQAITSTFTNSDIKGFKDFVNSSFSVEMTCSQRSCRDIYQFANKLIEYGCKNLETKNAFYPIKMQETEGRNPNSKNAIKTNIVEDEQEERKLIIENIKKILKNEPSASVAVLLRNNYQVNEYSTILKNEGISTISKTDALEQNQVFNIILSILRFCTEPWNNSFVQDVYQNIYKIKEENLYLNELETPFVCVNASLLNDETLISLHWELNYWLAQCDDSFESLVLKIGEYYSRTELDKSNLYIISEIVRRLAVDTKTRKEVVSKLEQIAKRPIVAGLKLFSENETTISTFLGGKVQVMTMHKSKGDEFDYVFVPEFTEGSLGTELKSIKTANFISFYETIKALDLKYKVKNAIELKTEILEENYRLLYVVITRAKKGLYFSAAKKYKKFGRLRTVEPSKLFDKFFNFI